MRRAALLAACIVAAVGAAVATAGARVGTPDAVLWGLLACYVLGAAPGRR
ncbi:hypothetical protein GCM10018962_77710 [Dactylosporangium matsuzakiense]